MKRESMIPRPDWPQKMEEVGFTFHSIDGVYWDERACYAFTAQEVDELEAATAELHQMCLDTVATIVKGGDYQHFAIPEAFLSLVEQSWRESEKSLYGRFDFSWDGRSSPKMLEYNADTPTALIEASVAQWYWLQDVKPRLPNGADQFNSLHEKLIARWEVMRADFPADGVVHFTCVGESEEDVGNLDYLRDTATQAGIDARFIDVTQIGWKAVSNAFVDEEEQRISVLFKLYPWEWLVREVFGPNLLKRSVKVVEPAWKMLLSNKAILPLLWQKYPDHPNLLACFFEPGKFASDFVKKPIYSREGANVTISTGAGEISVPGEYGAEGFVYQAYHPLPSFAGSHTVIGSWIVGDEAAGMGIREDESPVTRNTSRFLPHYFI
jgi:glutathionylspermidine synthase